MSDPSPPHQTGKTQLCSYAVYGFILQLGHPLGEAKSLAQGCVTDRSQPQNLSPVLYYSKPKPLCQHFSRFSWFLGNIFSSHLLMCPFFEIGTAFLTPEETISLVSSDLGKSNLFFYLVLGQGAISLASGDLGQK